MKWKREFIDRKTYYPLGEVGGVKVFMVQSEMGSSTPGGSLLTVHKAIQALSPTAVIMVGIAFGTRPRKQKMGSVLVSKQLQTYEPQKVTDGAYVPRGDRVTASTHLLDKFASGDLDWKGDAPVQFGLILSGEKLVNAAKFRDSLLELEQEAIGGEMEGVGLYVAASDAKVDWLLVKAICDWGDGSKNDEHQQVAARNAAAFTLHVIQEGGLARVTGPTASSPRSARDESEPDLCPLVPSTIPARYGRPFVGRDTELAEMLATLADTSGEKILVLHGQPGAGKSELGFEFGRTHRARYPGGTFLIRSGSGGVSVDLAGIGKNILGLSFAHDLPLDDQAQQTLQKLASAPTLLVYDNVTFLADVKDWLPPAGRPCQVVITTVIERIGGRLVDPPRAPACP